MRKSWAHLAGRKLRRRVAARETRAALCFRTQNTEAKGAGRVQNDEKYRAILHPPGHQKLSGIDHFFDETRRDYVQPKPRQSTRPTGRAGVESGGNGMREWRIPT